MIALDFDGVVANYNDHTTTIRINTGLLALLPRQRQPIAICTNQGGMAFSRHNPARYPTPAQVAKRLRGGCDFLRLHGYPVQAILISCYHPKAQESDIQHAAQQLRDFVALFAPAWRVYTTERARKPHPLMLRAAGATVYYGDSPEDGQAASAAGVPFVEVPRFL
jgi:hypothetical protein